MKKFKKISAVVCALVMVLSMAGIACAEDYNGYLGIQGDCYTFRNAWNEANYGIDGASKPEGYDFATGLIGWVDNEAQLFSATIQDATISGNGTFEVSMTDIEWNNDTTLKLLFVDTDIPYGEAIFTNIKAEMDGTEVFSLDATDMETDQEEGIWVLEDPELKDYVGYLLINTYNQEIPTFDYSLPTNVTVQFTVSGLPNDANPEDVVATPEPTDAPTDVPAETPTDAPTEASEATPAPTQAASTTTDSTDDDGGSNTGLIIGIIAIVVIVIVIVVVVATKKKK